MERRCTGKNNMKGDLGCQREGTCTTRNSEASSVAPCIKMETGLCDVPVDLSVNHTISKECEWNSHPPLPTADTEKSLTVSQLSPASSTEAVFQNDGVIVKLEPVDDLLNQEDEHGDVKGGERENGVEIESECVKESGRKDSVETECQQMRNESSTCQPASSKCGKQSASKNKQQKKPAKKRIRNPNSNSKRNLVRKIRCLDMDTTVSVRFISSINGARTGSTEDDVQSLPVFFDSGTREVDTKLYGCEACDVVFDQSSELKDHVTEHGGKTMVKCGACFKVFPFVSDLIRHSMTHTRKKPFPCSQCPSAFATQHDLGLHSRIHSGYKPFQCQHCPSVFARLTRLKEHTRLHTGERPYKCHLCSAAFTVSNHLKTHIKGHLNERPFKCQVCPSAFGSPSKLKVHMRIHTGERPFACEVCGAAFAQQSQLKNHMRIHTSDKPLACKHCPSTFSSQSSLSCHIAAVHSHVA